jgi:salicylate hydroxylase
MASFDVVVVGAGIGGLASALFLRKKGHKVIVLESAKQLSEIGAGIQIPPNTVRILHNQGLTPRFLEKVVVPFSINLRRYSTGEILKPTPLNPLMSQLVGHPYWLIHRADYQRLLYDAAIDAGVEVKLATHISAVDVESVNITLDSGEQLKADLIVGADGKFQARLHLLL